MSLSTPVWDGAGRVHRASGASALGL